MITHENTLSERERYVLNALASDSDAPTASRARALIEWSQGESKEQIAHATGLRPAQVQQLTRAFSQRRLEIFAPSSIERASRGLAGRTTVDMLLKQNRVNMAHARHVAELALQIFDETGPVHQLGPEWRPLLETGALVHNLGSADHDERHHRIGRNIVAAHEIEGFTPRERDILACLALFHTKKVKAPRDPIFSALDEEAQHATLALAAILRVADGLDFSQSQATSIASITLDSLVQATVEGPEADVDAARANKKADLWRDVLTPPFSARLPDGTLPESAGAKRPRAAAQLRPQEAITRAGRQIVAAQFARMRALEDDVRSGKKADAVHDMRVATRRMRSAFRLLAGFYSGKSIKRIRSGLGRLAGYLGEVRDLDVMLDNLRSHTAALPLEQQRALDPLLADWEARRAKAHRDLVEFMDDEDYAAWIERVEEFIEAKDRQTEPRVADVVPALVWKRYGRVREYEVKVKQPSLPVLHKLRIQCKRLRYALEFFAELMGPETASLLQPLIALQDYLGELHDADTAAHLVTDFIAEHAQRSGIDSGNLEAVTAYLTRLRSRTNEMQAGFPERWQLVVKSPYRESLGSAVAHL
ncbi:MAG: CHAD domain-containing protein [Rudaea sp.]